MKNRLIEFLNREQISASKLAEMIDVQASSISHILSERNKPGFDFLVKLFGAFPRLNPKWLMMGVGQMYLDTSEHKSNNDSNTITKSAELLKKQQSNQERDIRRIIIFYSDNTFETFDKK